MSIILSIIGGALFGTGFVGAFDPDTRPQGIFFVVVGLILWGLGIYVGAQ